MQNFESLHQPTSESNDWDLSQVPFAGDTLAAENLDTDPNPSEIDPTNSGSSAVTADLLPSSLDRSPAEAAETNLDPAEQAIENVRYWGHAYNDLESQFIQYRETVNLNDPKARSDYKTMLRRYEEEVRNVWGYMEDATQAAHVYNRLGDPYSRSAAQGIDIPGGAEGATIEASSSIFYADRVSALQSAIRDDTSLTPEEAKERNTLIRSTWSKVLARIEANQDIAERRKDPEAHFYYCNELHDNLIRHLNQLNDLAQSYHLDPFTPRNFITNDRNYVSQRDRNGDYHARVEADRSIVDYYFRQVFSSDYAKIDYKTSRDLGLPTF